MMENLINFEVNDNVTGSCNIHDHICLHFKGKYQNLLRMDRIEYEDLCFNCIYTQIGPHFCNKLEGRCTFDIVTRSWSGNLKGKIHMRGNVRESFCLDIDEVMSRFFTVNITKRSIFSG